MMSSWRRLRLRARLMLSFALVIIFTVVIMVVLANVITTTQINKMAAGWGLQMAERLAPLLAQYYEQEGGWDGVEIYLQAYQERIRHRAAPISRVPGRPAVPASGNGMLGGVLATPRAERLLLYDSQGDLIIDTNADGETLLLGPKELEENGAPILVDDQQVGTLVIASSLGRLTPSQEQQLRQITMLLLLAGLISTVAVALASEVQTRSILRPVRALVRAAHHIAGGDLTQRIRVNTSDELGEMATAFNTMAANLEQQSALRHRAMADIAHELRTPLSVLQIDLESLRDGLTEPTSSVIVGLKEEVTYLSRLVEDLRVLSLADAGELQMEMEQLNMATLVRNAIHRVQETARGRQIELLTQATDDLPMVTGDGQRLAQVLLSLLANALEHTPSDGCIIVGTRSTESEVLAWVADTGEGIGALDLPFIFDRLYRADRSRSRNTGGSGLGLTIARSIIEAHGGRIWAESEPGRGTTVTFALRRTPISGSK